MFTSSRPTFDRHSRIVSLNMVDQLATAEHIAVATVRKGFGVGMFTKRCVMVLTLCLGEGMHLFLRIRNAMKGGKKSLILWLCHIRGLRN
jgi:hypothetical protein